MSSLPLPLLLLLAIGVVVLLGYLSRRYPAVGIVASLSFLGTAIYFWESVGGSFRSDGSPAGAVVFVLFLGFELMLVVFGLWFMITTLTSGRREAAREREVESREQRLAAIRANAVDGDPPPGAPNQPGADRETPAISRSTATPRSSPSIDREPEDNPRSMKPSVEGVAAAALAMLLALAFAIAGTRLLLGISNQLLCGRRSCIDLFGLFARMQAQGLGVLVGLCYLTLSLPFFWVAYRALWPRADVPRKPRSWLDKYRKAPPRASSDDTASGNR